MMMALTWRAGMGAVCGEASMQRQPRGCIAALGDRSTICGCSSCAQRVRLMIARAGHAWRAALFRVGPAATMRATLAWVAMASLLCTTVLYVAGGPWVQYRITSAWESFLIHARPHDPPWPRRGTSVAHGDANTDRIVESNAEFPDLEKVLERAALSNRTVILTTLNQAWAKSNTMVHLFLESFRLGEEISHLLDHLVIVALDQVAYDQCKELHALCYMLKTEGVDFSGEKYFMTEDYLRMMWRRIYFLKYILEMGYSFVFSDADVMWFRDPFPRFDKVADFQMACDIYTGVAEDLNNLPNGGFLYARSNKRTIEFYKYWYRSREDHPGLHDQDVLNEIKGDQGFLDIGLQLRFLNTLEFSGFCQVSKDLEQVCTMHANCCTGLGRKVHDLRLVMEDWKRFKLLTPQMKHHQRIYWRAPRQCLLSKFENHSV